MRARAALPLVAAVLGASAQRPSVAPLFTAPVYFGDGGGGGMFDTDVKLRYSEALRTFKLERHERFDFLGANATTSMATYGQRERSFDLAQGKCYNASKFFDPAIETEGFEGLFGWVRRSESTGPDKAGNRTCERWRDQITNRTLCLDQDEPVYLEYPGQFAGKPYMARITFGPLSRHVDEKELRVPDACFNPPEVCGSGEVQEMDIYLLHPRGQFNISDQDAASAQGDAVYVCADHLWEVEDYKLATHYKISILQRFGQYLNCNLYPPYCVGPETFYVGREAPMGVGVGSSQCDDTEGWLEKAGVWYSLPAGGKCTEPGQQIGKDCAWRIERRVKTFELSCLFEQTNGFLDACTNATPPFADITARYLRAFQFEDPAVGGCPSVSPPGDAEPVLTDVVVV